MELHDTAGYAVSGATPEGLLALEQAQPELR
jgi:hypothetical protein